MSYKRGVRQGDPLSPILFYLTEDVLSRGISYLVHSNQLVPMAGPHGCSTPTPVLYADDIMLLCKRTKNNLRTLMTFFKEYGDISGQLLSLEKCKFYAGSMSVRRRNEITNILGFSAGALPFIYLGVALFKGKPKEVYLQPIADRIKSKLSSCKGSHLSLLWARSSWLIL